MNSTPTLARAVLAVALLLAAAPLTATSYVMATDDELLDRAEVVVLARVVSVEAAPDQERPATDYLIEIDRLIKGFVPASNLLVRIPGGQRPDGLAFRLIGAPAFASDEQVLLFLDTHDSGTFRLVELALGAFRIASTPSQKVAFRDLSAASETSLRNDPRAQERARSHKPRDLDAFADWLEDRAAGHVREADYFEVTPAGAQKVAAAFTVTRSGTEPFPSGCGSSGDMPIRWPEFDQGERVRIFSDVNGQEGVPGEGFDEIVDALQAWNSVSGTNIDLVYAGTTANFSSAREFDGRNTIIHGDPFDDVDGSFRGSGTVAVTLAGFDCFDINLWDNGTAHDLSEADVVFQDGTGSFLFSSSATPALDYAEVATHEVGHVIGIGHACGDETSPSCSGAGAAAAAIMRATLSGGGRGPNLGSDDREAARFLYPGDTVNPNPPPKQTAPNAPSNLTAIALNTSEIQLRWTDNATNETGYQLQERSIDGGFATIRTLAANSTSVIVTGIPQGSFRAYRLRATNGNGPSGFTGEASATTFVVPGDCIENDRTLCLNNDRFRVRADWERPNGEMGAGMAETISDDTGYFWFFSPDNVEAVVKALDGCRINTRYWVFAGGLTSVEVVLTVSDMDNGSTQTYFNPQSTPFAPIQDTGAFATCP